MSATATTSADAVAAGKPALQGAHADAVLVVEGGERLPEFVEFPVPGQPGCLHCVLQLAEEVSLRFALLVREDERGRSGLPLACGQLLHHSRRHGYEPILAVLHFPAPIGFRLHVEHVLLEIQVTPLRVSDLTLTASGPQKVFPHQPLFAIKQKGK